MEQAVEQIVTLFTKKLAYAAKILQISDEILKLLSEAKTEEAFELLEERKKIFETMKILIQNKTRSLQLMLWGVFITPRENLNAIREERLRDRRQP